MQVEQYSFLNDLVPPENNESFVDVIKQVMRVAVPLMISAGTFSIVLFADRTLLLWHSGPSMSAAMAAGNLFWVTACLTVGIMSMTGAIIGQHIGAGENEKVGRLLWQSVWLSLMFIPMFGGLAYGAESILTATGQPAELVSLEATYLRLLMFAAIGIVLETALSGFFSGIEKTRVVMWVSVLTGALNFVLDLVLIFGLGPIPSLGIAGAAIATSIAFWFKVLCFAWLMLQPKYAKFKIRHGIVFDWSVLRNLVFFGFPTGLMYVTESGGFAAIILRIGRLGDLPLRATTMAINFNTIAFIPLVGVSIAASVLTGKHLIETGADRASRYARASVVVGLGYAVIWVVAYLLFPGQLVQLYALEATDAISIEAISVAEDLLVFVSLFLLLDTVQLILGGALRGAGDTWFVLLVGLFASVTAIAVGLFYEPTERALQWWWGIIFVWLGLLAISMAARFWQGGWKRMRMV